MWRRHFPSNPPDCSHGISPFDCYRKTGRESTLRALNGQTSIAQGVKGQDGDVTADTPPDAVQVPAKVRASKLADPLSRAAAEDSRSTVPQPITPATRDDFAAMRRRARQANTATTLNF